MSSNAGDDADFNAAVGRTLSERLPPTKDRPWGAFSAVSDSARSRRQGLHIMFTLEEHVLGRTVKEPSFLIDSLSVSGRHCKVFRKNCDGELAAFIKDTSSNGTFLNSQKLIKSTPEVRLKHGDIVSFPFPAKEDNAFAFVYRDLSKEPSTAEAPLVGSIKRKAATATDDGTETKKPRVLGGAADGHLSDVRRLERSNQELRQKLEEERSKSESLNADLRAAKDMTEAKVKEAREQCIAEYSEKLAEVKRELSLKSQEFDDCSATSVHRQSVIEDMQKRLDSAAQTKQEAEEALQNLKAQRLELEKQLEDDRNQWKMEREELEATHKSALENAKASAAEELNRQAEGFLRKHKQLEDQIGSLQETISDDRNEIDCFRTRLEEERQKQMDHDKKAKELQIKLDREQNIIANLKLELGKMQEKDENLMKELEYHLVEREKLEAKVKEMELELAKQLNQLEVQKQRYEGERERVMLRETQIEAIYTTAEQIAILQKKQEDQMKSMMSACLDDIDLKAAQQGRSPEEDSQSNAQGETKDTSGNTHIQATQLEPAEDEKTMDLNVAAPEAGDGDEGMSFAPTQMVEEGLGEDAGTQPIVDDAPVDTMAVATQLIDGRAQVVDTTVAIATQLIRVDEVQTEAGDVGTQLINVANATQLKPDDHGDVQPMEATQAATLGNEGKVDQVDLERPPREKVQPSHTQTQSVNQSFGRRGFEKKLRLRRRSDESVQKGDAKHGRAAVPRFSAATANTGDFKTSEAAGSWLAPTPVQSLGEVLKSDSEVPMNVPMGVLMSPERVALWSQWDATSGHREAGGDNEDVDGDGIEEDGNNIEEDGNDGKGSGNQGRPGGDSRRDKENGEEVHTQGKKENQNDTQGNEKNQNDTQPENV